MKNEPIRVNTSVTRYESPKETEEFPSSARNEVENSFIFHTENASVAFSLFFTEVENERETWQLLIDGSQLILTAVGLLINLATFTTLWQNGRGFSPVIKLLLKHQALVDGLACAIALILLVQTPMWTTGYEWLDHIICHTWHSQFFYWSFVFLSVWNLGCIATERYLAVCKPLHHKTFSKGKIYLIFCAFYFCCLICNSLTLFQVVLVNGNCHSEYFFKGSYELYQAYAYIVFLTQYALPCAAFFILYRSVVLTLRKRTKEPNFAESRTITKATKELTKTAIIVTIIFIISLGYDLWYYILGYSGVIEYKFNSPLQVSCNFNFNLSKYVTS